MNSASEKNVIYKGQRFKGKSRAEVDERVRSFCASINFPCHFNGYQIEMKEGVTKKIGRFFRCHCCKKKKENEPIDLTTKFKHNFSLGCPFRFTVTYVNETSTEIIGEVTKIRNEHNHEELDPTQCSSLRKISLRTAEGKKLVQTLKLGKVTAKSAQVILERNFNTTFFYQDIANEMRPKEKRKEELFEAQKAIDFLEEKIGEEGVLKYSLDSIVLKLFLP